VHRGIRVQDALSIPASSGTIANSIESAIRGVDFICGIITPESSYNVLFEIGLAFGAKKPLFLIVDKEAKLPAILRDILYVRASPTDINALQFNIDNFLEHITTRPTSKKYVHTIGPGYSKLHEDAGLELLSNVEPGREGFELEAYLTNLFERNNTVVVQKADYPDSGVDMAIWIDEIESTLGNPVLIEVKVGRLSEDRLKKGELQLRRYLIQTNSSVGILVYLDQNGQQFPSSPSGWPLVIRIDARELAGLLANGELVSTLIQARNQAVHTAI
jgi:hypothetical protein